MSPTEFFPIRDSKGDLWRSAKVNRRRPSEGQLADLFVERHCREVRFMEGRPRIQFWPASEASWIGWDGEKWTGGEIHLHYRTGPSHTPMPTPAWLCETSRPWRPSRSGPRSTRPPQPQGRGAAASWRPRSWGRISRAPGQRWSSGCCRSPSRHTLRTPHGRSSGRGYARKPTALDRSKFSTLGPTPEELRRNQDFKRKLPSIRRAYREERVHDRRA
jgi:hypothetical protein